VFPYERLIHLKEQYEQQRSFLKESGILIPLKGALKGKEGIRTIAETGKTPLEVPLLTLPEITARLKTQETRQGHERGFMTHKIEQGLTLLCLTPFGMPLVALKKEGDNHVLDTDGYSLASIYARLLIQKQKEGKLYYPKRNPLDPSEQPVPIPDTEFNASEPLWISDDYKGPINKGADVEGTLVYFPTLFDPVNHQGHTKPSIITTNPSHAWIISLTETHKNIPRKGNAQVTGKDRYQLDTSGTQISQYIKEGQTLPCPDEFLNAFKGTDHANTIYKGERGQTPEEQLWKAICELLQTGSVMHNFRQDLGGHGSVNYLLGAYFPQTHTASPKGRVPSFGWYRVSRQAYLGWRDPGHLFGVCGCWPVAGEEF
jgi:hypothetical protein